MNKSSVVNNIYNCRNSNIELLRILSILFIVVSHYTVHNGVLNYTLPLGFNRFLLEISKLGNIGTIIFVLISGYFLINSSNIKIKKVIKIWTQVFFYSLVIYLLFIKIGLCEFSIKETIKNILPITFKQYWFASAYLILYIISPFLNLFLNRISRKEYIYFILTFFAIFSVLSTLTTSDYYGNVLIQFIFFYSIGAYMRKYPDNALRENSKKIAIFSAVAIGLSTIFMDILETKISIFGVHSTYLLGRTSVLAILFSVSIFCLFLNMDENNNILINEISSLVFGVYLISDNNFVREILWTDILHVSEYVNSKYLIIHFILSVSVVIIVCLIIDFLRKLLLEKQLFKSLDKKIDSFQNNIKKFIDKIVKY